MLFNQELVISPFHFGLVDERVVKASEKEYCKWVPKLAEGIEAKDHGVGMRELFSKLSPEVQVWFAISAIKEFATSVVNESVETISLVQFGEKDHVRDLYTSAKCRLDRLKTYCIHLREAVALRSAEGFSEWDFEQGCVKGGKRPEEAFATDALLRDLFGDD